MSLFLYLLALYNRLYKVKFLLHRFFSRGHQIFVVVVQLLGLVQLLVTPWTTAHQAPLSFMIFWGLLNFISRVSDAVWPFHPLLLSFFFCLQSFPASWSFPMSWLFVPCGQSIGASAWASVYSMNRIFRVDFLSNQLVWSPCSPRDTEVFSSTAVWKHQFFRSQLSLWSNSHIHTWLLEKP